MADPTREQRSVQIPPDGTRTGPTSSEATVSPARARAEAEATRTQRTELIRVGDRDTGDGSRTSPRMRFDVLQIAAWAVGLGLIVAALVAVARTGFDGVGPFEPVVTVGDQTATPLFAAIWFLAGLVVLAAGTGMVEERRLRIIGVLFATVGLVFTIEPDAFSEYLGVTAETGTVMVAAGLLLAVASFVPPLSVPRPGIREDR